MVENFQIKRKKAIVTKAVENSGKLSEQDVKDLTKNFSWAEQGAKDLGSNTTQPSNPEKITNQLGTENKSQGGSGNDSNGGNSGGNSNQGGQSQDGKSFTNDQPITNKIPEDVNSQGGGKYVNPEDGLSGGGRFPDAVKDGDIKSRSDTEAIKEEYGLGDVKDASVSKTNSPDASLAAQQGAVPPQQINMQQNQQQMQQQNQQINQLNEGQQLQEIQEEPIKPEPLPLPSDFDGE